MEGLIPLVYKTIRRSRTRRQYECLSAGAAQSYNIADFYGDDVGKQYASNTHDRQKSGELSAEKNGRHRRHKSFNIDYSSGALRSAEASAKKKELVRFRSHRLLSCVSAA